MQERVRQLKNSNSALRPAANRDSRRGNSVIEFALFAPWLLFLFVGAFDWGFYAYALQATQSAARVAALYTSSSNATAGDSATACSYAIDELKRIPNMSGVTTCGGSSPLTVTALSVASGPDLKPASQVTVTYTTMSLIPIPGLLTRQITITRIVQMRVRG